MRTSLQQLRIRKEAGGEASLPCPSCGLADQLRIGQRAIDSRLRWYESTNCSGCGLVTEADAIGLPPPAIHAQLLASGGRWVLLLRQAKSVARVARVLKDRLALDNSQSIALSRQSDGMLYQGSQTECMWLAEALAQIGEDAQVLRASD